jgi:acyl-CoA thioester hydrolase
VFPFPKIEVYSGRHRGIGYPVAPFRTARPMTAIARSDFGHFIHMPTRWADLDMLGHVNNAKFFTYDESVRLDYFSALFRDDPKFWKEYGLILARIECDFIAQLHHPATLDVGFRIARLGKSSMGTVAGHFDGERLVAVSRGVVVWFDYENQKTRPIPDGVRAMIRGRERVAPEE